MASFCECASEYGGTGAAAGFWPVVRQHESFNADAPLVSVIARQHSGCEDAGEANKQAESGIAVEKTIIASISNAPFEPQVKVQLPAFIVSICRPPPSRL